MELIIDIKKIQKLREIINSTPIFYESPALRPHWDLICSFMDRVEDSANNLNMLKLESESTLTQNKVILFFVHTEIIRSCISVLLDELKFSDINKQKSDIFCEKGFNEEGTDDKYFYHLRNLSFAHVLEVSHRSPYLIDKPKKERLYSPIIADSGSEIVISVYSTVRETSEVTPKIRKEKLFSYTIRKYSTLDYISTRLLDIVESYNRGWNNQKVLVGDDIIDMLQQLRGFYVERYEKYTVDYIDDVIKLVNYKPTIDRNVEFVEAYQEYSRNLIMQFIENFNDKDPSIHNHEFYDIFSMPRDIGLPNNNYVLEKILVYLDEDESGVNDYDFEPNTLSIFRHDKVYLGFEMLRIFKDQFSDRFMTIEYNMPFDEIQILVYTSLYSYHNNTNIREIFESITNPED